MMKSSKYINEQFNPEWDEVVEMAVIGHPVLAKTKYNIALHGTLAGDRERPHIHIYLYDDKRPFNKFNFEIALDEIVCYDEINLIRMKDQSSNIDKRNRDKCSWNGYTKLEYAFEDWLFDKCDLRGAFTDNLDAILYWYNQESGGEDDYNPLLEYIKKRGMKIHSKYYKYFSPEDKQNYKECFE